MVAVPKEVGSNPTLAHRSGGRHSLDGTKHSVHGGGKNRGSAKYRPLATESVILGAVPDTSTK